MSQDGTTVGGRFFSYEGLPPHMVPLTAQVIDQHGEVTDIQLERDGRPLTLKDRQPQWYPTGDKDGWSWGYTRDTR